MNKAREIIIQVIRNKVAVINIFCDSDSFNAEKYSYLMHELDGMLVCLKNIAESDHFYNIHFNSNNDGVKIEFGYYDENGNWIVIEG